MKKLFVSGFLLISILCSAAEPYNIVNGSPDGGGKQEADGSILLYRGDKEAKAYTLRAFSDVPVEPGKRYLFSFDYKIETQNDTNYIQAYVYPGIEKDGKVQWQEPPPYLLSPRKNKEWKRAQLFLKADDKTKFFRLDLRLGGDGINAKAYFRNMKIVPTTRLPEPTIETIGNYRIVSNSTDGSGKVENDTITLTRGSEETSGYSLYVTRDFDIDGSSGYILSFEMKIEQAATDSAKRCQALAYTCVGGDKSGKMQWFESYNNPRSKNMINGDWTKRTVDLPSHGDANINKLRVMFSLEGESPAVAGVRNIKLEKTGIPAKIVLEESNGAFKLDGKVDDPIWQNAAKFENFHVLGNSEKYAPVKTTAYLALKNKKLYIAYIADEPLQEKMKITPFIREGTPSIGIYNDDCVETFISNNKMNFSQLIVNPIGLMHWEEHSTGRTMSEWHARAKAIVSSRKFQAASTKTATGWSCEMVVPLEGFFDGFTGDGKTLYMNFTRHRTVKGDENYTFLPLNSYQLPNAFLPIELPPSCQVKAKEQKPIQPVFSRIMPVLDPAIPGKPVYLKMESDRVFNLPGSFNVVSKSSTIKDRALREILAQIQTPGAPEARISLIDGEVDSGISLSQEQKKKLKSPEAFRLMLKGSEIKITAGHLDGFMRALGTLSIMIEGARIKNSPHLPEMLMVDAPRLPFRSFMMGTTWQPPFNMDINKRGIDMAFKLRLNHIFIPMDSYMSRTRFPFETVKGLGSGDYTKEQWIDLFDYCRDRGIEPIAMFACFDNPRFMHNIPNSDWMFVPPQKHHLNAADPKVMELQLQVIREILETLRPKGFHIGMDESSYANAINTPEAKAKNWKHSDWLVECIKRSRDLVAEYGCTLYVWADTFDPDQLGKDIDMSGAELLKRIPKDVVMCDWKYDGITDNGGNCPSILMFKENGFKVIGCSWWNETAVMNLCRTAYKNGTAGVMQTGFGILADEMSPDMGRCLALTAYYSWSPEDSYLEKVDFIPEMLLAAAKGPVKKLYPKNMPTLLTVPASELISGEKFLQLTGLPKYFNVEAFASKAKMPSGTLMPTFKKDGKAAALAILGNSKEKIQIPIDGVAHVLTLLMATDLQPFSANMERDENVNRDALAGTLEVLFDNNKVVKVPLRMRMETTGINDVFLPRYAYPGFFGTVDSKIFVNVPIFQWRNPFPHEKIKSITLLPGNRAYIRLLVMGAAIS
ncbi:MAG: family 20 glycosylhydrolase [Victivallales bacterium]|jgi:hypothetical protein|nr:family 20 glycosylhydrolase [Victivallales bacterium]